MKKYLLLLILFQSFLAFCQEKFDLNNVLKFQKELNEEFANAKTSPLYPNDLEVFKSLNFYPINQNFFVTGNFKRTKKEKPFEMPTSTERKKTYVKYGEVEFTLNQKQYKLNIYQSLDLIKQTKYKDHLFLPFSDLTCGKESYIGGRYIDLKIPKTKTIIIDFNMAYNPFCAYSHKYSCPKVPLENDLDVEITAGVKKFHD